MTQFSSSRLRKNDYFEEKNLDFSLYKLVGKDCIAIFQNHQCHERQCQEIDENNSSRMVDENKVKERIV